MLTTGPFFSTWSRNSPIVRQLKSSGSSTSIATRDPSADPGPPGATGAGENPQFPATTLVTPCSRLIFINSSWFASASVQSAWECMSMKPGDTMQPLASST